MLRYVQQVVAPVVRHQYVSGPVTTEVITTTTRRASVVQVAQPVIQVTHAVAAPCASTLLGASYVAM